MKKITYRHLRYLLFSCLTIAIMMLSACEDDETNPPLINEIRNYEASPNDTVVQTVSAGQWVVLLGKNLSDVSQVTFNGVPAGINYALFTDQSMVIQIPSIPFQSVPNDQRNIIMVVSSGGTAIIEIKITGAPLITHVRNYDASPNDTLLTSVAPGQHINLIGFNLEGATSINFQGVEADLSSVVYTDSSTIVIVPDDFSGGDASLANRITYTTTVGDQVLSIPIFDPAILEYYKDPLWTLLTGGIGNEKIWMIDFNAQGVSKKFAGPLWFSGEELRWEYGCATEGGNCWNWAPDWQSWMPGPNDYGTMTFKLNGVPIIPVVAVNQKGLDAAKNGNFSGDFFLDTDAKTITFTDVIPLNMGWDNVDWSKAYIITLTEDGMQLGFKHNGKPELELYNYIPK
jgi:hypothetical protein